ncbi:MAG: hypothetical protein RBS49_08675 [Sphaerochaeta sp.]|jgi:hypothetical protein|nr:hypothetical protein [Sphaerochaeta sp.]MDX9915952.1 hypothetical protein [Sphaerochaeta sp.]
MRKHIVLVLLVPILALTLISCDADMRSSFANFLGGLGGNVYVDGGLVEPNKADVKAATDTIAGLGSGNGAQVFDAGDDGKTDTFGIEVDIPAGVTTVMKPQLKEDQDKLKDDLANTLNSPQQTAELKEELKKPVSDPGRIEAVKGTVEVFNKTIEALVDDVVDADLKEALGKLALPTVDDDDVTEGDVLLVQLMTNLISNTIGTLDSIKGDGGHLGDNVQDEENKNKLLTIIDDALFTAQIAEELSGAASIDFSGQLDLANLMSELNKSSRASRDGDDDDFDISDFIGSINNLGPELVKMFGLKKIDDGYGWESGGYRKFISTQQAYRGALEHALSFAGKGGHLGNLENRGLVFDGSTAIKYLIAVAVTEANTWNADNTKQMITASVNANTWIATGTATEDTEPGEPDLGDIDPEDFGKYLYNKDTTGKYVKQIFTNTKLINDVAGITQLSEALDAFLKDDFDEWFDELAGEGD